MGIMVKIFPVYQISFWLYFKLSIFNDETNAAYNRFKVGALLATDAETDLAQELIAVIYLLFP